MNSARFTTEDERRWLAQSNARKRRVDPYRAPDLPENALHWVAVRTRPKMEARAIEELLELNIRAYCPHGLYERRVGKARRREDFTRPLFTSYVLAGLDPAEPPLGVVVGLDSVVAIVSVDQEQPAWVSWSHVEALQVSEDMGLFDFRKSVQAVQLSLGERVFLTSPLGEEYEATVERVPKTRERPVLVSVNGVKIEAALSDVRKVV